MKKLFALIIALITIVSIAHAELYPMTLMIYDIDVENDLFYATDYSGNQSWVFDEIEDWCVGDLMGIIFDDNETENIYDDIAMSYRYCGWIEPTAWIAP